MVARLRSSGQGFVAGGISTSEELLCIDIALFGQRTNEPYGGRVITSLNRGSSVL